MANLVDDFLLGVAGATDLVVNHVPGAKYSPLAAAEVLVGGADQPGHLAAKVYADQAAEDPAHQYSQTLAAAAKNGASADDLHNIALAAADDATNKGALDKAAKNALNQIADPKQWPWYVWGAIALGGAVAVAYVVRAFK